MLGVTMTIKGETMSDELKKSVDIIVKLCRAIDTLNELELQLVEEHLERRKVVLGVTSEALDTINVKWPKKDPF